MGPLRCPTRTSPLATGAVRCVLELAHRRWRQTSARSKGGKQAYCGRQACCGERARPRWSAQRSQPRHLGLPDRPRRQVLGPLRCPTRASPLATGGVRCVLELQGARHRHLPRIADGDKQAAGRGGVVGTVEQVLYVDLELDLLPLDLGVVGGESVRHGVAR